MSSGRDLAIPFPPQELPFSVSTIYSGQAMKEIKVGFLRDLANPAALQGHVIWAAGLSHSQIV